MQKVSVQGVGLEYVRLAPVRRRESARPILLLHEGLGSVSLWRTFPQLLANACGCEAVVYSRQGHGGSDPASGPRDRRYLHHEAVDVLPALIEALELERPLLFGHSDGATIAMLCAGETSTQLSGLVIAAPHVLVEDVTLAGIRETVAAWSSTDLRQRLSRHHSAQNLDSVFASWHETWLDPGFSDWNVESCLPAIRCPVLAIQGEDDEYATLEQFHRIVGQIADVSALELPRCGHSPHREATEAVIAATQVFVERVLGSR